MTTKKPSRRDHFNSYMTFDEYGRPFIILKEQEEREQITGLEVIKVCKILLKNICPFTSAVNSIGII